MSFGGSGGTGLGAQMAGGIINGQQSGLPNAPPPPPNPPMFGSSAAGRKQHQQAGANTGFAGTILGGAGGDTTSNKTLLGQ